MVERGGPRAREGGAGESGPGRQGASGGASSAWWGADRVIAELPEELRPIAAQISDRIFLNDEETEASALDGPESRPLEPNDLFLLLRTFRSAIFESEDHGSRPEQRRILHLRLDREMLRLSREMLARAFVESRRVLHDVSHDIRSPLNSVLFLADTLLSGHSGDLSAVQRRQLGVLYTAAVTLVGLVNDVIDAARLHGASEIPISHTSFSVESVLSDVENLVAPLAIHRSVQIRFHLETLGPRTGDRQLLSRLLLNLVTNAIKAVDEGGSVEVRVAEPRAGWLRVGVCDDGPGETIEQLRSLIDAETEDLYASRGGVGWTHGLGLAICSRLVRAAGGNIEAASAPGGGTCLVVELPFARV